MSDFKRVFDKLMKVQHDLKDTLKGTKGYGYKYSTLDDVLKEIRPKLKQHGLGFFQKHEVRDSYMVVTGVVFDEEGGAIEIPTFLPLCDLKGMNGFQSMGSGITYGRRYNTQLVFNITAEEDKDGSGEEEPKGASLKLVGKGRGGF